MRINQTKTNKSSVNQESGFSLVEVLVAFFILIIILITVLESRLGSVRRIEQTGNLNQIQDRIRKDIAAVRKQALKWKCQPGTACTGLASDRNNPPRYVDLVPPDYLYLVDPASPSHYCNKEDPLAEFQEIIPDIPSTDNKNISISRSMEINNENKKQLDITYAGKSGEKTISSSTSIIPQAMNWCS